MKFAINYVCGGHNKIIVIDASDNDEAYEQARSYLIKEKLYSASLQGHAREATQSDVKNADVILNDAKLAKLIMVAKKLVKA